MWTRSCQPVKVISDGSRNLSFEPESFMRIMAEIFNVVGRIIGHILVLRSEENKTEIQEGPLSPCPSGE